jgi:hypothetical protein
MSSVRDVVGYLLVGLVGLVLLGFLAFIVRFSALSPLRTRGARSRLRRPEPEALARLVGFAPPEALLEMYREDGCVERLEFEMVDARVMPPRIWEIGGFIPMTVWDVREARIVHHLRDGIPIAEDMDKGCYVVLASGAVVLRSPTVPDGEVDVADSVTDLRGFVAREPDTSDS